MRKTVSLILTAATVFCALIMFPDMSASAESLYIRKIVSVVYDDSGSMSMDGCANWAYANYALQAFCGLLNSDDQLFLTYMSEVEKNPKLNPPGVKLGVTSIQNSVNAVRKHTASGNTPYNAVSIAFNKLKSIKDSNENTQYWLVVITDGEFQTAGGNVSVAELTRKLTSYTSERMPNGSSPQISYLAIGEKATKPTENREAGLFVYKSTGAADIVNTMSVIADKISGRTRLSPGEIVKKGSNIIEIHSAVPLLNIAVLSQKTSATIVSASSGNSTKLNVARSASISYPERSGWVTDNTLNGGTFLINNSSGNIEASTYQLKFSDDVNPENVVIMFEPALEIRMSVTINGKSINNISELSRANENDVLGVTCNIFEIGTNNEISADLLPQDTAYKLSVVENGKEVQACSTSEMTINEWKLNNVLTEITASFKIKGFNPIVLSTGAFTPIKAHVYYIGVDQPDNLSFTMSQLKDNSQKIQFIVYADGKPIDKKTAMSLPFSVNTKMPGSVVYEDDGKISFTPSFQEPITAIPTGKVEVTGSLEGIASKTTSFYVKPLEYSVKVVSSGSLAVVRSDLSNNLQGVEFEVYVDGEKLDKKAVEAAEIKYTVNAPYSEKLKLNILVADDGTITASPTYEKNKWTAAYIVPTGEMDITASTNEATATGRINITKDAVSELIWNWLVPAACIAFLIGEVFKRRFKYSSKIHYNHGESSGTTVTGPKNGWNTAGLFTLLALIPFVPDVKVVNGAKFYARGFMWNTTVIGVKTSQHPAFSGTVDGGINELESVRFSKNDVNEFEEGEKKRDMIPGHVLVTSGDRNYRSCQIYLYSEN